jgi:hypothetical protein
VLDVRGVKRVAVLAALAAALAGLLGAPEARAAQCGLPDAQPWWIDFASGSVSFRYWIWGRSGVIAATEGGPTVPQKLQNYGAKTVFWQMRLGDLVGTTQKPADPATIPAAAQRLYEKAVAASASCAQPIIALNELNGPGTTTPWTATNAQYRANVLELVNQLTARGARPFLLLPSTPYTGGDAAGWWRAVAQSADLLPEVYFSGPSMWRQGPIAASRSMRRSLRQAIRSLTALGIPTSRLGFVLGFQSSPGGRAGLQPASAWYQVVKWEALAARQVAGETGVASVWSWGWATFSADKSGDDEKKVAACVYLWTRDGSLCDAHAAAGQSFNDSLAEGQIDALPAGVQCQTGPLTIQTAAIDQLAQLTGDRDVAYTLLLQRIVEEQQTAVSPSDTAEAERAAIALAFGGKPATYSAALAAAHASPDTVRALLADVIRRTRIQATLPASTPTAAQVSTFYRSYPTRLVRLVRTGAPVRWLGGRSSGYALQGVAPDRVFGLAPGLPSTLWTSAGVVTVTPARPTEPLGAVPFALVRPAVALGLRWSSQAIGFDAWTSARQTAALAQTVCLRDDLPEIGAIDPSLFLSFLALSY